MLHILMYEPLRFSHFHPREMKPALEVGIAKLMVRHDPSTLQFLSPLALTTTFAL